MISTGYILIQKFSPITVFHQSLLTPELILLLTNLYWPLHLVPRNHGGQKSLTYKYLVPLPLLVQLIFSNPLVLC